MQRPRAKPLGPRVGWGGAGRLDVAALPLGLGGFQCAARETVRNTGATAGVAFEKKAIDTKEYSDCMWECESIYSEAPEGETNAHESELWSPHAS